MSNTLTVNKLINLCQILKSKGYGDYEVCVTYDGCCLTCPSSKYEVDEEDKTIILDDDDFL